MKNDALPEGWNRRRLGDVLVDIQPGFASGKHSSNGEGLPHLRPMNVSRDGRIDRRDLRSVDPALADTPRRRLKRGDVLFNNTNSLALVGKTALFSDRDEPAFSNHMTRLRVRPDLADPAFVAWFLHSRWQAGEFQRLANNHVSQASVGRAVLEALPIILPPLCGQRHIARRLDEIDARRSMIADRLVIAEQIVVRLRSAILAAACTGRLTTDWREKHPDVTADRLLQGFPRQRDGRRRPRHHLSDVDGLTSEAQMRLLPSSWRLIRLGHVVGVATGATPLRKRRAYFEDGTVPWVTSGAVNDGVIERPTELITLLAVKETNVKLFPPGTLLIAMYGEGQTRGRVGELAIEAGTNQAVAALVFDDDAVPLRPFVRIFFEDSYQRIRALSVGGVQPNLNLGMIKNTLLPLPPLAEQREIVRRAQAALVAADRLDAAITAARTALDRVMRGALAKAFRGELVPNEAELRTGEPAHDTADRRAVSTP